MLFTHHSQQEVNSSCTLWQQPTQTTSDLQIASEMGYSGAGIIRWLKLQFSWKLLQLWHYTVTSFFRWGKQTWKSIYGNYRGFMATTCSNTTRFSIVFFRIKFKQKMQVYPYSSSQDTHLLLVFISPSFCSTFALPFHHYLMSPCNAWIQTNPFFLVFAFSFSSCRFWSNDKVPPNHCESDVVSGAWTTARGLAVIVSSSAVLLNSALSDPFPVFDQPNSAAKSTISALWNWVKALELGLKLRSAHQQ